jgi:hypothetical protein
VRPRGTGPAAEPRSGLGFGGGGGGGGGYLLATWCYLVLANGATCLLPCRVAGASLRHLPWPIKEEERDPYCGISGSVS